MTAITKSFTVQEDKLELVKDRLAKMNRKAVVLGIAPSIISSCVARLVKSTKTNEWTGKSVTVVTPVFDVTVTAHEIKFGNYTHVATLDHTVSDMPIVKSVPDQIVPTSYQSAKPHCDHCGIVRQRNNTFVFKDAVGYKQVGSSCLREFFGIDPTKTIDWFSSFYELGNNDEFGGFAEPTASNKTVVALAMAVAETQGYVSGKQAKETGIESTSDAVKFLLNPPSHMDAATKAYIIATWSRADELKLDAVNMIAWGVAKFADDDSDYAHNMRIFLGAGYTKDKYFGYLVSVIGAFKRDAGIAVSADSRADNEFIGVVGDKITTNVVVNKIIVIEGNYGRSYINIMSQAETGNNLVWFASNNILNEGDQVAIKGTIKALNVKDGKNQTQLTRCKVI